MAAEAEDQQLLAALLAELLLLMVVAVLVQDLHHLHLMVLLEQLIEVAVADLAVAEVQTIQLAELVVQVSLL